MNVNDLLIQLKNGAVMQGCQGSSEKDTQPE